MRNNNSTFDFLVMTICDAANLVDFYVCTYGIFAIKLKLEQTIKDLILFFISDADDMLIEHN